jgi:hypothetical protein
MKKQILDHFEDEKTTKYTYKSGRKFFISLISYLLIIGLSLLSRFLRLSIDSISIPILLLGLVAVYNSFLGSIYGIKSFIHKEPNQLRKIGSTVGNLVLFMIFLLILITNIMDIMVAMR